jgi:hypothetical protein
MYGVGYIPSRILGEVCHVDSPKCPGLTASDQSSLGRVAFLQLDGFDADVVGVGFNPRLGRPFARDLNL